LQKFVQQLSEPPELVQVLGGRLAIRQVGPVRALRAFDADFAVAGYTRALDLREHNHASCALCQWYSVNRRV